MVLSLDDFGVVPDAGLILLRRVAVRLGTSRTSVLPDDCPVVATFLGLLSYIAVAALLDFCPVIDTALGLLCAVVTVTIKTSTTGTFARGTSILRNPRPVAGACLGLGGCVAHAGLLDLCPVVDTALGLRGLVVRLTAELDDPRFVAGALLGLLGTISIALLANERPVVDTALGLLSIVVIAHLPDFCPVKYTSYRGRGVIVIAGLLVDDCVAYAGLILNRCVTGARQCRLAHRNEDAQNHC